MIKRYDNYFTNCQKYRWTFFEQEIGRGAESIKEEVIEWMM